MHDGKDYVNSLAAAAAVKRDQRGIGRIGRHNNALSAPQYFGKHLLRRTADKPVAFFSDADGHSFIFVRIEATNHGSGRGKRDFMFAGAAAKENANAESFFVIWGHGRFQFSVISNQFSVIRENGSEV